MLAGLNKSLEADNQANQAESGESWTEHEQMTGLQR